MLECNGKPLCVKDRYVGMQWGTFMCKGQVCWNAMGNLSGRLLVV